MLTVPRAGFKSFEDYNGTLVSQRLRLIGPARRRGQPLAGSVVLF